MYCADEFESVSPEEVAKRLRALPSLANYESQTLLFDKSQPPTPDGTDRPQNLQTVAPGLYRSSYPLFSHFDRLEDLDLKTIITLVPQDLPLSYGNFISTHGIIHHQIPTLANKDPSIYTGAETVNQILELMLDPTNYPMLIHCNKGKHRTGCIVACFRKVCGWTDEAAVEEYIRYSTPKERDLDRVFIERFDPADLKALALDRGYVGGVYKQPLVGETAGSERSNATVYTNNSVATYGTDEDELILHEYQERVRKENNDIMESSRLWNHR